MKNLPTSIASKSFIIWRDIAFDILFLPKYQKGENVGAEMKGG